MTYPGTTDLKNCTLCTGTRSDVQLCAGHKRLKKSKKTVFSLYIYSFRCTFMYTHINVNFYLASYTVASYPYIHTCICIPMYTCDP
jgi:hypothetical protein